jgi:hypothetical protein
MSPDSPAARVQVWLGDAFMYFEFVGQDCDQDQGADKLGAEGTERSAAKSTKSQHLMSA